MRTVDPATFCLVGESMDDHRMSSHSYLSIQSQQLFLARETYYPDLVSLFSESDFESCPDEGDNYTFVGYKSSAGKLRQRLSALGVTAKGANSKLTQAVELAKMNSLGSFETDIKENSVFDRLNEEWPESPKSAAEVLAIAKQYLDHEFGPDVYEPAEEYCDPRIFSRIDLKHHVRLLLDQLDDDCPVALNLTELKNDSCCYEWVSELTKIVRLDTISDVTTSLPMLVLTEGSTDALAIERAIQVTHPHLVDFVVVMNFAAKPEGSISGMMRNVKALIAGRVPNRIVAIADNDSAARDALTSKFISTLPDTVKVLHYPEVDSMRSYPAIDPNGNLVNVDVNGRAGSLEMYFGSDILSVNGIRTPIRWKGLQNRIGEIQGVVENKRALGDRFRVKSEKQLRLLEQNPGAEPVGDWEDMKSIVESIVCAFD